jgi:hypothetical protein
MCCDSELELVGAEEEKGTPTISNTFHSFIYAITSLQTSILFAKYLLSLDRN